MKDTRFNAYSQSEKVVRDQMMFCKNKGHFQQVAYSVHGECFTQVCFSCKKVRTTLNEV